jgi:hypothetical protein
MDNSALETLLSKYNWWMGLSTIAVALGILGEYVAHFIFERDAKRNRIEMVLGILLGVLVLGGVVGEYIFGSKLSDVAGQLQRKADGEVATLNKSAADAIKDAANAGKAAGEANEAAGIANEKAGESNKRAAKLEKEAAALKESAEGERLARVKIEERLAWRRITSQQHDRFVSGLKPYAGSYVRLTVLGNGDLESETFARDIAEVLKGAHWRADLDLTSIKIPAPVGLDCRVDERTDAGKVLFELLKVLPTAVVTKKPLSGGVVALITVGLRPPP